MHGMVENTRGVLRDMRANGGAITTREWDALIAAAGASGDAGGAARVLDEMASAGFAPDVETVNALIAAAGVAGDAELALSVLTSMAARGGGGAGAASAAAAGATPRVLGRIPEVPRRAVPAVAAVAPNSRTYAAAVRACGVTGNLKGACARVSH
jgi:pentatricopeptide repeat protein